MDVCALFNWNDDIVNMLKKSNVVGASDELEKKHRLVCYFLEKLFDPLLGKKSVSSNPDFESFIGQWKQKIGVNI